MRLATIAADVGNFPVYEEVPPVREEDILSCNMTNIQDIEDLIDVFFAAVWYPPLEISDTRDLILIHRIRHVALSIYSDGIILKISLVSGLVVLLKRIVVELQSCTFPLHMHRRPALRPRWTSIVLSRFIVVADRLRYWN